MDPDAIAERKTLGAQAAREQNAAEPKEYGQTSPDVYPYTYWWKVGFNEAVAKR